MEASIPQGAVHICINAFQRPSVISATEELHDGMSEQRRKLHDLEMKLSRLIDTRKPEYRNPLDLNRVSNDELY